MIKPYRTYKGKDYWITTEDININGVIIKKGFIFDGLSVPKIVRIFIPNLSIKYLEPAILHDYFYSCKYNGIRNRNRKEVDLIFYQQVKEQSRIKAILFYLAVRIFGWLHYKKPLPFKKGKNF